ncbi:MAG: GTPase Era [Deltaproteobacteria bacterium]|jgi:GTP-binding protein Era
MTDETPHRSGYVALVGRPNVGKSTILNALLGQKIAATTHKPQTTRKNLLGVLNPPGAQLLLLDTPGHHQAKGPLNRYMVAQAEQAIAEADVIALVVEAREDDRVTPGNERILGVLSQSTKPVVLVLNKVDRVKNKEGMLLQIQRFESEIGERLAAVVPISASKKKGLDRLLKELAGALPEGPSYFEGEEVTNESERSIVAEFVREKVMLATKDELPYSAAVTLDSFEDKRPKIVRIAATIHVERPSQKAIVIGRRGERIKDIGTRARKDIEYLVGTKVFLELHVRVTGDWSSDAGAMAKLGYGGPSGDEPEVEISPQLLAEAMAQIEEEEA